MLNRAREEIRRSWRRACRDHRDHPRAAELFDPERLPAFHDPFAGGGSLPLEAQRLGLEAYASDLNPVAVLICKAMIEIPPRFAGRAPVNPAARRSLAHGGTWRGAQGLAEDVRSYGQWMREEAERRIGHLYPPVEITEEMARERPDLKPYVGRKLTVIAWVWARTVRSPNPAFANVEVPLASTFMLSTKAGKEAYVQPVIEGRSYRFTVKVGKPKDPEAAKHGTSAGKRRGISVPDVRCADHLRLHSGRRTSRTVGRAADGDRRRGRARARCTWRRRRSTRRRRARQSRTWKLEVEICHWPGRTNVVEYGLTKFGDLFTPRQLVALTTFSDLVGEAIERVRRDALAAGLPDDDVPLRDGGTGARAYAEAVGVYLSFVVDKCTDYWNSLATWMPRGTVGHLFARHAVPMTWDFPEANPLSEFHCAWHEAAEWVATSIATLSCDRAGYGHQEDARVQTVSLCKIVSTDPPYFDNVGYADLSDFFYVWLRRSFKSVYPEVFATVAVPKAEELVATPYRHGSKEKAEQFFLDGMTRALARIARAGAPGVSGHDLLRVQAARSEGRGERGKRGG
ncbi:MAG: hypothetical protein RML12_00355 [Xanthomonadales bacterium]|nr:hypothetical protein [Xanthomonadales bacterium]